RPRQPRPSTAGRPAASRPGRPRAARRSARATRDRSWQAAGGPWREAGPMSAASKEQAGGQRRHDYRPGGTVKGTSLFAVLRRTVAEFSEDNLSDWAAALT